MPVPSRLQDATLSHRALAVARGLGIAALAGAVTVASVVVGVATGAAPAPLQPAAGAPGAPGAAYFIRSLSSPRERREARPGVLDRPVLPGSVVKALTLVAALESGVVTPEGGTMCRRVVTVDGVRFTCAHPDLKRPLTPAEALAYSCNDFFVSLAPRLTREQVNRTRLAAGLPPIVPGTPMGPRSSGWPARAAARARSSTCWPVSWRSGPDPRCP